MKFTIILTLTAFAAIASANDKTANPDESKPLELPDFSGLQQTSSASGKISVDMNCQTNDGQTFKSGDAGFESCMAQKGKQK